MMVDEADVVNEPVAGLPSRKRRDSRSPPASPRDKRRRAELSPNLPKRANPPTPPTLPLENVNQPTLPVSQPVAYLPQPPGIISDRPPIHNVQLNHNVKVTSPIPAKKRKLPEGEAWNEQRKQAKQSVNPQLRKLQQLHHNKQHSQANSAFTSPGGVGKDKLESSKDISSILRNACMVGNTSNAKATTSKVDNKKALTNHGLHNDSNANKNDKTGLRKREVLKSKALRKIYEDNTKLRQMICKQMRSLGQGKCLSFKYTENLLVETIKCSKQNDVFRLTYNALRATSNECLKTDSTRNTYRYVTLTDRSS